jgi:hypothetical protein
MESGYYQISFGGTRFHASISVDIVVVLQNVGPMLKALAGKRLRSLPDIGFSRSGFLVGNLILCPNAFKS